MSPLDENPNCAATYVAFRLLGDALVAAEVTRVLGLEPDVAVDKGAIRPSRTRDLVQRTGVWCISSEGMLTTTSLERHIIWLLERLEPVSAALADLRARQGLSADFFAYWVSATNDGGPILSPQTLGRMAALDAELGIDFWHDRAADDR